MADDRVLYNGVWMNPDWPARIATAQSITHYIIGGRPYPRVRYGDEGEDWCDSRGPCHDCRAVRGQFHVGPVCDMERCPRCGGQVFSCDCDYEGDED